MEMRPQDISGYLRISRENPHQSCGVNAVFICDHLPELGADLISALASLDVHELAHGFRSLVAKKGTDCLDTLRA